MGKIPKLPDDAIAELSQLLDMSEEKQLAVGCWLVDMWTELGQAYANVFQENAKEHGKEWTIEYATRKAHSWFIRYLANETNRDESTLRDRERVYKFWHVREHKLEGYNYSQVRALMAAGDNWEEVKRATEQESERYGKLPSTRAIRNYIRDNGEVPKWQNRWKRFIRLAELLAEDEDAPDYVQACAGHVITSNFSG